MILSDEMLSMVKSKAEQIEYGKITICLNETSGGVDITVEERHRFPKRIEPEMGKVVRVFKKG